MNPSNTDYIVVRNPNPIYTDTVGIFKREEIGNIQLDFIRTLNTNIGLVDEYELIKRNQGPSGPFFVYRVQDYVIVIKLPLTATVQPGIMVSSKGKQIMFERTAEYYEDDTSGTVNFQVFFVLNKFEVVSTSWFHDFYDLQKAVGGWVNNGVLPN